MRFSIATARWITSLPSRISTCPRQIFQMPPPCRQLTPKYQGNWIGDRRFVELTNITIPPTASLIHSCILREANLFSTAPASSTDSVMEALANLSLRTKTSRQSVISLPSSTNTFVFTTIPSTSNTSKWSMVTFVFLVLCPESQQLRMNLKNTIPDVSLPELVTQGKHYINSTIVLTKARIDYKYRSSEHMKLIIDRISLGAKSHYYFAQDTNSKRSVKRQRNFPLDFTGKVLNSIS